MSDPINVGQLVTFARPMQTLLSRRQLANWGMLAAGGALVLVLILGVALRPDAQLTDFTAKMLAPSSAHWFGTDAMGRDLFARTVAGLTTSIQIGALAATVSAVIAVLLGTMAAIGPRWLDAAISWLVDLMLGIPHILLLILISFAIGRGYWGVTIGVAVTHWPALSRLIRAEILQLKSAPYVQVAARLGHRPWQVARDHFLPAIVPQFIVGLVLLFPHAILHEAAITFLGFGLPPELPAVGSILAESMGYLASGLWWAAILPGLALLFVVLSIDAVGAALRTQLSPATAQD